MPTKSPRFYFTLSTTDGEAVETLSKQCGLAPSSMLQLIVPAAVSAIREQGQGIALPIRFSLVPPGPVAAASKVRAAQPPR